MIQKLFTLGPSPELAEPPAYEDLVSEVASFCRSAGSDFDLADFDFSLANTVINSINPYAFEFRDLTVSVKLRPRNYVPGLPAPISPT